MGFELDGLRDGFLRPQQWRDVPLAMETETRCDYRDKGEEDEDEDDYADIGEMTPPLAPQECTPM